ncbi:MAG: NAD(P)/FAD-dependent oxidoreductase [Sulfuricurvum sp.]|uniref:flavin monoamine oxidase family protein n=1 Tax=Sulfuricurvum sp. TaxID=2025608 RepID=UPI002620B58A|nr:NAD(P)/FAD-dependent oxidoreductase [Sulfuricurvum sp.]MDD2369906.1 NAD(P)/FAD-dependent oxidoreductase [Sulfuricurvum sp.]MDD5118230.1 NAD(P)/FAD-dependent oxidoreductase [Sulfuricurvum sp.]
MKKIAIIGGGLSGLYAATLLENNYNITLFEARERLGGRVYTVDGFDLGPSWIWPHQNRIVELVRSLGLSIFRQYRNGEALYETPQEVQRFNPAPNAPSGRIIGGIGALIDQLALQLKRAQINLCETVQMLAQNNDQILLTSNKNEYQFDHVIITLPPRLTLQSLRFDPPLPTELQNRFAATPTWMGHSVKCVIEFETPFWREMGLSGFCFSHSGPMGEVHDACTFDRYALFGFIRSETDMRTIEAQVRQQLQHLFGENASPIIGFHCVDWRKELFSSVEIDARPLMEHPNYGLNSDYLNNKITFIGTETSYHEGGYLEGALASTDKIAHLLNT